MTCFSWPESGSEGTSRLCNLRKAPWEQVWNFLRENLMCAWTGVGSGTAAVTVLQPNNALYALCTLLPWPPERDPAGRVGRLSFPPNMAAPFRLQVCKLEVG